MKQRESITLLGDMAAHDWQDCAPRMATEFVASASKLLSTGDS